MGKLLLKIEKIHEEIKETIEIDQYIPIKIKWGKWDLCSENTFYWRTGDFKKSLIEVGIASKSGLIRSVTLVHSDYISFEQMENDLTNTVEHGAPMFLINSVEEKTRLDEQGMLRVNYSSCTLGIILSSNPIVKKVINGRVVFELDNCSNVCRITITNLTTNEDIQIRDTLNFISKQNKF